MKFGIDTYGRYIEHGHPAMGEANRDAIEWCPFVNTWRRPAFVANIFVAPYVIAWHVSKLTGWRWAR